MATVVNSKHAPSVDPVTTTAPAPVKTTIVKTGCDVGSAAFDGGCCASTSIFNCDGTMYCASGCPAPKTVTTTSAESAAASTTIPSAAPSTTVPSTTSSSFPSSTAITSLSTSSTLATTKSTTKHSSTLGEAAWTTSANSAVQLTSTPTHAAAAAAHSGLSTGVQAAIGVGSAVLFLLIISVGIFFCCMARKKRHGEKKKVVEVGVGSDWRRGGYSYKAAIPAVAGLARSASRKLRGYQHDLSGGRYGTNNGGNWRDGPFPGQANYDEMPAVELSHPNAHGGAYGGMHSGQHGAAYGAQHDPHDLENKQRLAAIRESIYGPM